MGKKKILVVDDETGFTRMVKLNLESTGDYEVWTENQGTRAIEAARSVQPDLIFLDIIMPDTEGSEIARQLKADAALSKVPVIFLTATITTDEVRQTGGVIGGQSFLAKPVTLKQLTDSINKHLASV